MTPIISCTGNETWVIITSSIVYFEVFVRPIILYKNVEQKFQISFEYKMQYKIIKKIKRQTTLIFDSLSILNIYNKIRRV